MYKITALYIITILCTGTASCKACDNDLISTQGSAQGGAFGGSELGIGNPMNYPAYGQMLGRLGGGTTITTDTYEVPNLFPNADGTRGHTHSSVTRILPADQLPPASDILRFWGVPPRR